MLIGVEAVWERQGVANTVPADPALVTVPSSSWVSGGISPFGSGTFSGLPITTPNTAWTRMTGLWIRRFVTLDGQAPVLLTGACRQAFYLYFDGEYVATLNEANDPVEGLTQYSVVIPAALADSGSHEIALLCLDNTAGDGIFNYISLEADYLPAMLAAQPEAPASEQLSWTTDVSVSKNGLEERIQVQTAPRQQFEYTYPATAVRKTVLFNTVWGSLGKEWLVPIWPQAQFLGAVSAGVTTLPGVDTEAEFRPAGLALLWQSEAVWQVVGVQSSGSGAVVLSTVTQAFDSAWLMPLRKGAILDNVTRELTGHEASFRISYVILDNEALAPAAPAQYLSDDVYTDESMMKGDRASDDMLSNLDVFDPGMSALVFYQNWTHSKLAHSQRVVCEDRAEAWALREFLHRRAGKYRAFWQPSFENDLRLESTGSIVSTVRFAKDDYLRHAADRVHLAFDVNGSWMFRAVTNATQFDPDTVELTLDTALNVAADTVRRVCWLGLKRLNTDRIEIQYPGGGTAETEFRLLEIAP